MTHASFSSTQFVIGWRNERRGQRKKRKYSNNDDDLKVLSFNFICHCRRQGVGVRGGGARGIVSFLFLFCVCGTD